MFKTIVRTLTSLLAAGSLLQFGGCLGAGARRVLQDTVTHAGLEFFLDNAAVFDLFAD